MVGDSMSFETISDVELEQPCCLCCCSCICPCLCNDLGDIIVYGEDISSGGKKSWRLKKIADSEAMHTKLTKLAQSQNENFRQNAKNLGKAVHNLKK